MWIYDYWDYISGMTVIAAMRSAQGILVNADSLGIGIDENRRVVDVRSNFQKLFPVTDTVMVGVAGDRFRPDKFGDYAVSLAATLADRNINDIDSICNTAAERLKDITITLDKGYAEVLIVGYATRGSNKLKPFMATIKPDYTIEYADTCFSGVGIRYIVESFSQNLASNGILDKPREDNAEAAHYMNQLFEYARREEKIGMKQSQANRVIPHIGGKIRQYWITSDGIQEQDSKLEYTALVNKGDKLEV